MKRTQISLLGIAIALAANFYVRGCGTEADQTFFMKELRHIDLDDLQTQEGVISHLREDFSSYAAFSRSLDPFEDPAGLQSTGAILGVSDDNYGGERSVCIQGAGATTRVSRRIDQDLSRWRDGGVLSLWVKLADQAAVDRIDLVLADADGTEAVLPGIPNLHLPREENALKSDDPFPDHYFRGRQPLRKWEDYMLVNGWNYVFWEYGDALGIDMSRVRSYRVEIVGAETNRQAMLFDNLRIQDGVVKDRNPLNGNWYAPNGLPQYGVFDYDGPGRVRLLNVEWEQYPSNGDHVRILSRDAGPEAFILRARFRVVKLTPTRRTWLPRALRNRLRPAGTSPLHNTYVRLQWDFDNEYDPGHDWSGIYNSLEYGYLGLRRVYPIERYFVQGSEPEGNAHEGRTRFRLAAGRTYEFNVKVEGQRAQVVVYEIRGARYRRVARLDHTFRKSRPEKRYPIAVETTGNIQVELHAVEVVSLH